MKVAVVGGGAVGTAASRFLAKAGHEVHLFEQFRIGHDRGSSHGTSRIIRKSYPDPYYAALMEEVYPLWRELEADSGQAIYVETGLLMIGKENSAWMRDTRSALTATRTAFESMGPVDVARRFGGFHLDLDEYALFQPEAGYLRSEVAITANLEVAKSYGVQVHEDMRVESVADGRILGISFDSIVLCAGAWTPKFVTANLEPRLQRFAYFDAPIRSDIPVWIDSCAQMFYGCPNYGRGFKVGRHLYGPMVDPDSPDDVRDEMMDQIISSARLRLGAEVLLEEHRCLYTVAPNEDFRIGTVPGEVPTYFISACSGHGYKFSIWFGWLALQLVEQKKRTSDYPRFSVD